jgi:aryl-alcohol dehydrogenase-like predicted oxidoreductase
MEQRQLGNLWPVSALALGGGGIAQIWGETTRQEAVATARAAVDQGITLLDMAPSYGKGEAEMVIGEAFDGKLPEGVRITTKCNAGTLGADKMLDKIERSVVRSLKTMKREQADIFFLHSQIIPEDYEMKEGVETQHLWCTKWRSYEDAFLPAMEALKKKGLIAAWGITGVGLPSLVMQALRHEQRPDAVQIITNLMDSPGGIRRYEEPPEPRNIIRTALNNNVGVVGIRAVQAGALTAHMDRLLETTNPDMIDYIRARPWRDLCEELGEDPALLAHRYALAMDGVSTVVLGVKNRDELQGVLDAEAKGPLNPEIISKINALRLNFFRPMIPMEV